MTWKILQVLLPILIGAALRTLRVFSDEDGTLLRKFTVRLPIPVMIFLTMYTAPNEAVSEIPPMAASFLLITMGLFVTGWLLSKTVSDAGKKAAVHVSTTFGNYGWMGFGVCQILVGDVGLRLVMFFILLWWPVFYGLGLFIGRMHIRSAEGPSIRNAFVTAGPIIGAMVLGFILSRTGVDIPQKAMLALQPFNDMAIPLILLCAGLIMDVRKVPAALPAALMVSAATLIAGPLIGWGVASLVASSPAMKAVIIIEAGMPVATFIPALRENYRLDTDVAGASLVLSTALSMITLPVLAGLLLS